jgi:hypothetical protein
MRSAVLPFLCGTHARFYTHDSLVFGGCTLAFPLAVAGMPATDVPSGLQTQAS